MNRIICLKFPQL